MHIVKDMICLLAGIVAGLTMLYLAKRSVPADYSLLMNFIMGGLVAVTYLLSRKLLGQHKATS